MIKEIKSYIEKLSNNDEISRLRKKYSQLPRHVPLDFKLMCSTIHVPDFASFSSAYTNIFEKKEYLFKSSKEKPHIIDCGANIGLSLLFYKSIYPESEILAFEPDAEILKYLNKNIHSFSLKNITVEPYAVWNEEAEVNFYPDGSDAGRLAIEMEDAISRKVKTKKLSAYITREVDFLKLDVEGAEYVIINSIKRELSLIKNIYIEYHNFENKEQTLGEILNILKEAGFRYHINGYTQIDSPLMGNAHSYLGMDMQLGIYCTRDG